MLECLLVVSNDLRGGNAAVGRVNDVVNEVNDILDIPDVFIAHFTDAEVAKSVELLFVDSARLVSVQQTGDLVDSSFPIAKTAFGQFEAHDAGIEESEADKSLHRCLFFRVLFY